MILWWCRSEISVRFWASGPFYNWGSSLLGAVDRRITWFGFLSHPALVAPNFWETETETETDLTGVGIPFSGRSRICNPRLVPDPKSREWPNKSLRQIRKMIRKRYLKICREDNLWAMSRFQGGPFCWISMPLNCQYTKSYYRANDTKFGDVVQNWTSYCMEGKTLVQSSRSCLLWMNKLNQFQLRWKEKG